MALSLSVLMAGAWMVQQHNGNSGWVDTIWTFAVGLVGVGGAVWPRHAHLHPSFGRLSVRSRRPGRLDRAALLHRRRDAEPSSDPAIRRFIRVEKEWRWSGTHYQRTALDWLANFDSRRDEIEGILRGVYGSDTSLWMRRWCWFSSPCRDCSVTPTASNGASVISG